MEQRIVCAANRIGETDVVLLGARHWDSWMHKQFKESSIPERRIAPCVQGFIDNRGNFLTRTEAWLVAKNAGQILRRCGGDGNDGGTLYSENLY